MSVQALAKGVRMSPRKTGVVANLVRGRSVADALIILENTPRRIDDVVVRVIKSAESNALHNHNYKPNTLRITENTVSPGPRLKRIRPAARGSALRFQRKSSHIRVKVDGEIREVKKPSKKTVTTKKEAK